MIRLPSFLFPGQLPPVASLADATSCRYFEKLVHRVEAGGCSRTAVEGRMSSSYVQSQAVLGTPGVSW